LKKGIDKFEKKLQEEGVITTMMNTSTAYTVLH
jgi:hypothetical protein